MKSMQPTMWLGTMVYILFISLAYASEQICLQHCTYMSHLTTTVVYIQNSHFCTYQLKNSKLQLLMNLLLLYMCQQQKCPSNATYMPSIPAASCAHTKQLCQYVNFKWTQCNQKCDYQHWYIYISHYRFMPQKQICLPHCTYYIPLD